MKTLLKKTTVVVSLSTMMLVTFVGCGAKETKCAGCGEVKKCYNYEMSYEGNKETAYYCNKCAETVKEYAKEYGIKVKKK